MPLSAKDLKSALASNPELAAQIEAVVAEQKEKDVRFDDFPSIVMLEKGRDFVEFSNGFETRRGSYVRPVGNRHLIQYGEDYFLAADPDEAWVPYDASGVNDIETDG